MFDPVDPKANFSDLERRTLELWQKHDIKKESFSKPATRGVYVFFEGPPTANGKPGIHHVSARAFKDVYPRYKTMQGYQVTRRAGWDTHGLPVEVEVEKEIGSTGKRDIERYGIARFNERCRESVFRYIQDWNLLTERIAYWVDLEHAYITYSNDYIETCWWILKSLWERELLYEDYKVTMHCPRCNSTLADHEVSQGMRDDVEDASIWPKFRVLAEDLVARGIVGSQPASDVFLLPWTTTPWTLPANAALAVRGDALYALVEASGRRGDDTSRTLYIVADDRVRHTFEGDNAQVLNRFGGNTLAGVRYEALFVAREPQGKEGSAPRRVIVDDSVEIGEGTGVLHVSPAYGDLQIGKLHGLPTLFSVDLEGKVMPEVRLLVGEQSTSYEGVFFKEADRLIQRDLNRAGRLYRAERVRHAYPFCWRDDTPLLFYAKTSWYIRTTAVKDKLLSNNDRINWVPGSIGSGRFGRWLENNVDWAITRERYWGCPFPLWEAEDGSRVCIGSVAELQSLTGRDLSDLDLHRPYVDDIAFERDGRTYRRVPYTIDVWFESGAMPYAQWHYPFTGETGLQSRFPADFICEAIDQTRGWFYSLHAIATLLTDSGDPATGRPPGALSEAFPDSVAFRNCVVLGFVDDAEGRKMSKSRGNVVDPWTVIDEHGVDALRWYFFASGSPDVNKRFDVANVVDVRRRFMLTLWNVYSFFTLYARIDEPSLDPRIPVGERPDSDRWLIARLNVLVRDVTARLDEYDVTGATRIIERFVIDDLSQWYVRTNRRRFWKSESDRNKAAAYQTLYEVLVTTAHLLAPMMPFLAEELYQNLVVRVDPAATVSVHLRRWPEPDDRLINAALLRDMDVILRLIDLGRAARAEANVKSRQPLPEVIVRVANDEEVSVVHRLQTLLLNELNVKTLSILGFGSDFVSYTVRPNSRVIGPRLGRDFPAFRQFLAEQSAAKIAENVRNGRATRLEYAGKTLELEPEAFHVDVHGPDGYAATESGPYLVALNTTITEELRAEGQVRELTRLIQNARKNAGFNVTDRIRLGLRLDERLSHALGRQTEYVCQEALVEDLHLEPIHDPEHSESADVDGDTVMITLQRIQG